jgi:hypothetical protein
MRCGSRHTRTANHVCGLRQESSFSGRGIQHTRTADAGHSQYPALMPWQSAGVRQPMQLQAAVQAAPAPTATSDVHIPSSQNNS